MLIISDNHDQSRQPGFCQDRLGHVQPSSAQFSVYVSHLLQCACLALVKEVHKTTDMLCSFVEMAPPLLANICKASTCNTDGRKSMREGSFSHSFCLLTGQGEGRSQFFRATKSTVLFTFLVTLPLQSLLSIIKYATIRKCFISVSVVE
jgi:hypothetical protein